MVARQAARCLGAAAWGTEAVPPRIAAIATVPNQMCQNRICAGRLSRLIFRRPRGHDLLADRLGRSVFKTAPVDRHADQLVLPAGFEPKTGDPLPLRTETGGRVGRDQVIRPVGRCVLPVMRPSALGPRRYTAANAEILGCTPAGDDEARVAARHDLTEQVTHAGVWGIDGKRCRRAIVIQLPNPARRRTNPISRIGQETHVLLPGSTQAMRDRALRRLRAGSMVSAC